MTAWLGPLAAPALIGTRRIRARPLATLALVVAVSAAGGLIGWSGIYVASALYIGFFMRWLGRYPWWKVAAVSIGNSVAFFLIFEVWFKVPLPKGPLENLLGVG